MTLYASKGPDSPDGTAVYAVDDDQQRLLPKRLDLATHSPSGFSWGYGGSGPAQLALAISADAMGDEWALEHYQEVKNELVAAADPDEPLRIRARELPEVLD